MFLLQGILAKVAAAPEETVVIVAHGDLIGELTALLGLEETAANRRAVQASGQHLSRYVPPSARARNTHTRRRPLRNPPCSRAAGVAKLKMAGRAARVAGAGASCSLVRRGGPTAGASAPLAPGPNCCFPCTSSCGPRVHGNCVALRVLAPRTRSDIGKGWWLLNAEVRVAAGVDLAPFLLLNCKSCFAPENSRLARS